MTWGCLQVAVFSAFVNLLLLVSPFFMMQAFDRMLASGHAETLYLLTLIAILAFATYGALEWIRGCIRARLGARIEDELADDTLLGALDGSISGRSGAGQVVRDLQRVRSIVASPSVLPFFDAPWAPLFLLTLWLLHPVAGAFATGAADMLLALAVLGEFVLRKWQASAINLALSSQRQIDTDLEHAAVVVTLGMRRNLLARWDRARQQASTLLLAADEGSALLSALAKGLRQVVQIGILAVCALLVLQGELTAGGMLAASILLGRALAPTDQSISAWRSFLGARLAWRRLRGHLDAVHRQGAIVPLRLPSPKGQLPASQIAWRFSLAWRQRCSSRLRSAPLWSICWPRSSGRWSAHFAKAELAARAQHLCR